MTVETAAVDGDLEPFTRDRWGRPLIPDLVTRELRPYTRVSTFAQVLTPPYLVDYNLWWGMRTAHLFPDLTGPMVASDEPPTGQQEMIRTLTHNAGMNEKRDRGTVRHTRVRQVLTGNQLPDLTDEQAQQLQHVVDVVQSLGTITGVETPLVCDEWSVAGSADYVGVCPDGTPFIADLKTGKRHSDSHTSWAIQLIAYARSQRWDPITGQRAGYVCDSLPRLYIVHAPQAEPDNIQVHAFDPEIAKTLGQIAASVFAARRLRPQLKG